MLGHFRTALLSLGVLLAGLRLVHAADNSTSTGPRYVTYTTASGQTEYLLDNRKPALYTQNWGECLDDNAINLTRFDAAYYQDNMTVIFHMAGNSQIANDSLMMYIGVFAYGENRFELVFNPCSANIESLCPVNKSIPITASGIIPVSPSDISNIPSIAFSIPDFEGEAILRIFSNTTEQEIGCYSAVVTNGASFSQPASVGSVLGVFTFIAMVASFATAIYGEAVPTMRLHYAHSMSVGLVFAVFQHIFFTGSMSLNWPSVLPAWWSNFAWSGGMIYTRSMQQSIQNLIGTNTGNTTEVGAAESGSTQYNLGGGYDISLIYRRALSLGKRIFDHPLARDMASDIYRRDHIANPLRRDALQRIAQRALLKRDDLANSSTGYIWYGHKVDPELPLPGNFSGFAGTLSFQGIPVSHAFMTGFLWFLICFLAVVGTVALFKWILEAFAAIKLIKKDRLLFFRARWLQYTGLVALRTCYIGFFMMMLLTTFQFSYDSAGGVKAVAAIMFVIFLLGIPAVVAYAVYYKFNVHDKKSAGAATATSPKTFLQRMSWFGRGKPATTSNEETITEHYGTEGKSSVPVGSTSSIHDDEDYTMKFGWLASRFRRTRWWFFAFWTGYVFLEAIFYGGASSSGLAQLIGLLIVEILACSFIIWARPFEGQRLNILVVYCLAFSKITTLVLSFTFYVQFDLNRIITTAIGIIIIVIQAFLTIITLIAIILGAASSYASVSRNRETFHPKRYAGLREKYFDHLDRVADDLPRPPRPAKEVPPEPKYGFELSSVRRIPKVEDEDQQFVNELRNDGTASTRVSMHSDRGPSHGRRSGTASPVSRSRAASMTSTHQNSLPFGARSHRPSWSIHDMDRDDTTDFPRSFPDDSSSAPPVPPIPRTHSRTSSRNDLTRLQPRPSAESLHIGGDVSTRDTIGKVPVPTTRARTGTINSARSSRALSMSASSLNELLPSTNNHQSSSNRHSYIEDSIYDAPLPPLPQHLPSSNRGSGAFSPRQFALTPAQEMEEWIAPQHVPLPAERRAGGSSSRP